MDSAGLRRRSRRVGGPASGAPGRHHARRGGRLSRAGRSSFLWLGPWSASGPRHLRYAQLRSPTGGHQLDSDRSSFSFSAASGWPVKTCAPAGATGAARRGWRQPPSSLSARDVGLRRAPRRARSDEIDVIIGNGLANASVISVFALAHLRGARALRAPALAAHADLVDARSPRRRFRDPLVGRDLLIGVGGGRPDGPDQRPAASHRSRLARSAAAPPRPPFFVASPRTRWPGPRACPSSGSCWTLGIVFFLVFVRRLVKMEWLAAAIVTLLFSANFLGTVFRSWIVGMLLHGRPRFVVDPLRPSRRARPRRSSRRLCRGFCGRRTRRPGTSIRARS